eukprot:COSAG02_NODE_70010_length_197_cov_90.367347_1_plen_59_part_01
MTSVLFTLRFPAILWISIISKKRRVAPLLENSIIQASLRDGLQVVLCLQLQIYFLVVEG